jgi:hypothetical protein
MKILCHINVFRFDVPVHDVRCMKHRQSSRQLRSKPPNFLNGNDQPPQKYQNSENKSQSQRQQTSSVIGFDHVSRCPR